MKNKEYYLSLNYPVLVERFIDEEEVLYSAEIKELPGLIVYGETVAEVMEDIETAKEEWIEVNLELGRRIPEPRPKKSEYSGRLTLRLPKSLHKEVAELSEDEGVSVNQCVVQLINSGLRENSFQEILDKVHSLQKGFSRFTQKVSYTFVAQTNSDNNVYSYSKKQGELENKYLESNERNILRLEA